MRRNLILIAAMLAALGVVTIAALPDPRDPAWEVAVAVVALIPLVVWLFYGSDRISREIEGLRDQLFEETGDATEIEVRAERLFLLHRSELDRYYVETRVQSRWVFVAGLLAIVFGVRGLSR